MAEAERAAAERDELEGRLAAAVHDSRQQYEVLEREARLRAEQLEREVAAADRRAADREGLRQANTSS